MNGNQPICARMAKGGARIVQIDSPSPSAPLVSERDNASSECGADAFFRPSVPQASTACITGTGIDEGWLGCCAPQLANRAPNERTLSGTTSLRGGGGIMGRWTLFLSALWGRLRAMKHRTTTNLPVFHAKRRDCTNL